MTNLTLDPAISATADAPANDALRDVLMESRQRWRHLVGLAADLAFETDPQGRFVFVMPDAALGWPRGSLIGQPSELLLGGLPTGPVANPFCPPAEIRRHRTELRAADGSLVRMVISATPLTDVAGDRMGARGVGIDISEQQLGLARQRVATIGADNVQLVLDDAATHGFTPEAFDLGITRFGVMFFADPVMAFRNIGRAMKPSGRLLLTVFRSGLENPWATAVVAAIQHLVPPPPPLGPDDPGQFSWADPARVRRLSAMSSASRGWRPKSPN